MRVTSTWTSSASGHTNTSVSFQFHGSVLIRELHRFYVPPTISIVPSRCKTTSTCPSITRRASQIWTTPVSPFLHYNTTICQYCDLRFVMVASTAMTAACLSSLLLGTFMCTLIVLCRKFGRDPGKYCIPASGLHTFSNIATSCRN